MALSNTKVNELLNLVSSEFDIDIDLLCKKVENIWTPEGRWASGAAKKLAKKHKISLSEISASGKDGRILEKDVKLAAGLPLVSKKKLGPFVSTKALNLAKENGLNGDTRKNFPRKFRTGLDKKGKKNKITLNDVRRVAGIDADGNKLSPFASTAAEKFAKKFNIKSEDIKEKNGAGGKILKSDVEYHIELTSGKSESDSEINSGSESDSDSESESDMDIDME